MCLFCKIHTGKDMFAMRFTVPLMPLLLQGYLPCIVNFFHQRLLMSLSCGWKILRRRWWSLSSVEWYDRMMVQVSPSMCTCNETKSLSFSRFMIIIWGLEKIYSVKKNSTKSLFNSHSGGRRRTNETKLSGFSFRQKFLSSSMIKLKKSMEFDLWQFD